MADDLATGLEKWLKGIEENGALTAEKKTKVTGAGAEVFAKVLKANTPASGENYKNSRSVGHAKGRKTKHLKDSITYKAGVNHDKLPTGDTAVGFEDSYSAMVGRFVNNGTRDMSTKEMKNMHFFEDSMVESREAVLRAEAERMKNL